MLLIQKKKKKKQNQKVFKSKRDHQLKTTGEKKVSGNRLSLFKIHVSYLGNLKPTRNT